MTLDQKTVLVTGAAGFVGMACLKQLADAGVKTIGTYRSEIPAAAPTDVIWEKLDLEDRSAVADLFAKHQPTDLISMAWYMGPGNQKAIENFTWLQNSLDLVADFAKSGGQRITFCGSCMEYDWSEPKKLHETGTKLRPDTEYGASKAALNLVFAKLCEKLELSHAWVRPFFIYGPHEGPKRLAADVIISLLQGKEALCSHGMQKRDFLHVDDVGSGIVKVALSEKQGNFNIGCGAAITLKELIEEAGNQIGAADLIRLGAREAPPNEAPFVEADNTRLKTELDWSPKFDLKSGIADTISWWKEELGINQ